MYIYYNSLSLSTNLWGSYYGAIFFTVLGSVFFSVRSSFAFSDPGQDLGTQIHFWDAFQSACKKRGMKKRDIDLKRFVPPDLAEFMAGCQTAMYDNSKQL